MSLNDDMKIAVFAKGTRTSGVPAYRTDEESAAYIVACGLAKWVNRRYNSIIMLCDRAMLKLRDMSCSMGPGVTLNAVMGSKHHDALVAGWKPRIHVLEYAEAA